MEQTWTYSLWGAAAGAAALALVGLHVGRLGNRRSGRDNDAEAIRSGCRCSANPDLHREIPGQCKCPRKSRRVEEHHPVVVAPRLYRERRMGDLRPEPAIRVGGRLC